MVQRTNLARNPLVARSGAPARLSSGVRKAQTCEPAEDTRLATNPTPALKKKGGGNFRRLC